MTLRKSIFWLHLSAGLVVGIIVAIMSATGIALAFEQEILGWLDRDVRKVAVPEQVMPHTLNQLDAIVKQERPEFKATTIVIPSNPAQAYEYRAGRAGSLYVNPYTGELREPKSTAAHDVLHVMEDWHRRLGRKGETQATGKLITGIANVAFLFLCLTGLYMWWPRSWKPKALRPAVLFVGGLRGRARDFNWHHVFGSWSVLVLIVIVASGVVLSFGWAHRLVFTLAGEQAPVSRGPGMLAGPTVTVPSPAADQQRLSRDVVLSQVGKAFPGWEAIGFDRGAPPSKDIAIQPLNVLVFMPAAFQTRGRIQLSVDPYRGDILQKLSFEDRTPGARARVWLRFLHTGEAFGLIGKIIATIATTGSLFLVYTGIALSYRRFFSSKAIASNSP